VASGQRRRAVAVKVFVEIADEAGTTASQTFDYSAERGRHPSFETLIEGANLLSTESRREHNGGECHVSR
jgi:hypothetical protein